MIYFVGAGPGAEDLITMRGYRLLQSAKVVVYAGSLVNRQLLNACRGDCQIFDSAHMTLDEVIEVLAKHEAPGEVVVRLHTGDPSIYGAIREQIDALRVLKLSFEIVPGVSSFFAAAAALEAEYTLPDVSQTVIITRMAGRTPVPEKENMRLLAAHNSTMVIFLSVHKISVLCGELIAGGYSEETPAAIVYKASWPDQKVVRGTLSTLPALSSGITKTALVLVGNFMGNEYSLSKLYDSSFTHGYREAKQ